MELEIAERTDKQTIANEVKRELEIAIFDFNISHTYQASKAFLPKIKFELLFLSEGLIIYDSMFRLFRSMPGFHFKGVELDYHPLETIKEIIVI